MNSFLTIDSVSLVYDNTPVLDAVSLELASGEIGCLLGASGTGKSSLLRLIAGFENLSAGKITLDEQIVSSMAMHKPAHQRGVGMVFQDHALFPHLTVRENIVFGLHKLSTGEQQHRLQELLVLTGLNGQAEKYPHQLSGGQQQRVALARALAPQPKLLLMDEPFASLDTELRKQLAMDVRKLLKAQSTTALLVTHDQQEAFAMADKVGLLENGKLQQWDTAYRMYHRPTNRAVARFIGEGVFLPAVIDSEKCIKTAFGEFCSLQALKVPAGQAAEVLIRPDDVIHDETSTTRAIVSKRQFRGAEFLYTLELENGMEVLALFPSHLDYVIGEHIGIRLELDHVITFPLF